MCSLGSWQGIRPGLWCQAWGAPKRAQGPGASPQPLAGLQVLPGQMLTQGFHPQRLDINHRSSAKCVSASSDPPVDEKTHPGHLQATGRRAPTRGHGGKRLGDSSGGTTWPRLQQQGLGMGSHGRAMNLSGDLVKGGTQEPKLLLPCVGCLLCRDTRHVPVLQQQLGSVTPGTPLPHHKVCGAQRWKPSSATKIFKEPLSSSK